MEELIIKKGDLFKKYYELDRGEEGIVFDYDNHYALKVFDKEKYNMSTEENRNRYKNKLQKVEAMFKLKDPSFCFPLEFLSFSSNNPVGYYMDKVLYNSDIKRDYTFSYLRRLANSCYNEELLNLLIEGSDAIERIHKKDIILADIKEKNIMIDKNWRVKFVDTDNYRYQDFDFDLHPFKAECLKNRYGRDMSMKDNDIFLYAVLVFDILLEGDFPNYIDDDNIFDLYINKLSIPKEAKEKLLCIFSDADNKPYVGSVLRDIPSDEKVLIKR